MDNQPTQSQMLFTLFPSTPQPIKQKVTDLFYVVPLNQLSGKNRVYQQNQDFINVLSLKPKFVYNTLWPNIQKWNTTYFQNQYPYEGNARGLYKKTQILKCIKHVDFTNLSSLDLNSNNIESIEPLSNMKIPNLKDLNLSTNKFVSLKPLAKLSLRKLKSLDLDLNYWNDHGFEDVSRFGLGQLEFFELKRPVFYGFLYCNLPKNGFMVVKYLMKLQINERLHLSSDFVKEILFDEDNHDLMMRRVNKQV